MSDVLNMSDEDFLRQGESLNTVSDEPEEQINDASIEESETEISESTEETEELVEETTETGEEELPSENESNEEEKADNSQSAEEQLAKLFAPFKANGRELKIESVEEAVALMQMGANYSKKMAGLINHYFLTFSRYVD